MRVVQHKGKDTQDAGIERIVHHKDECHSALSYQASNFFAQCCLCQEIKSRKWFVKEQK